MLATQFNHYATPLEKFVDVDFEDAGQFAETMMPEPKLNYGNQSLWIPCRPINLHRTNDGGSIMRARLASSVTT